MNIYIIIVTINICTTLVQSQIPLRYDPDYARGYSLIKDALLNFQSKRIGTWPNKIHQITTTEKIEDIAILIAEDLTTVKEVKIPVIEVQSTKAIETTTVSPTLVTEWTRTTGGGLLLHLSLPPPGSGQGTPPQQLMDNLKSQIQSTNPGVMLDWVRPTSEKCPAEQDFRFRDENGTPLHWPSTNIGESALALEACLDVNMHPVQRPCLQDLTFGAQWGDPEAACENETISPATTALLNVTKQTVTVENAGHMTQMLAQALSMADTPKAGDVLLVAGALAKLTSAAHGLTAANVPDLASLLDGVLRSSDVPEQSEDNVNQDTQATKSILSSLDTILSKMSLDDAQNGVASSHTSRTALLVADIARSGLSGASAMSTSPGDDGAFAGVQPLSVDSKLNDQAEVSARLLGDLNEGRASFVFIGSSRTFPKQNSEIVLNSRVVGVTMTGGRGSNTEIELEIRPLNEPGPGLERQCAFWDLEQGIWSTEGCKLIRHDIQTGRDVCRCTHLTHFGEIIGVQVHSVVLDVISLIGCVLSLLGLLGIALTAIFFRQWRSRLGNKILLHLSGAIGLTMISFLGIALGGANGGTGDPGCIILGILMHYSILAAFCWMLVSAALQLLRFVVVISARPPHFLLKGVLFGWGAPLIPVIGLLISGPITSYSALDLEDGNAPFCYPRDLKLILAVILPVSLAVIANLITFFVIIYRVSCGRNKKLHGKVTGISERQMAIRQLRMSILLFFLLGLSWVFGLLALLSPSELLEEYKIILSYLFCGTATLQGLALFLFFVAWERKARALWLATLPENIRSRGTISEITSAMSPSTASSSIRVHEESKPLRHRNTELELKRQIRANSKNNYNSTYYIPTHL